MLVADEYVLKIADFGLTRNVQETDYYRKTTDVSYFYYYQNVAMKVYYWMSPSILLFDLLDTS